MKRYLKLYWHFFRNCLIRELGFRFNVFVLSLTNIFWLGVIISSLTLIFGQVDSLAGWNKQEVLVLAVVATLFRDIMEVFFMGNLQRFSYFIRRGELDFILLKPVSTRFMVSFRYVEFHNFLRIALILIILPSLFSSAGIQATLGEWLCFLSFFVIGMIVFYNIFFMIVTTNFWLINIFNFNDIFDRFLSAGRYPVDIFKGALKSFFTYLIPLGLIGTLPVEILLGRPAQTSLIMAMVILITSSLISEWFWRFGLKHYQSASS